jgi:hypothetical protein
MHALPTSLARLCLAAALLAPLGTARAAQTITPVETIDFDRPESWAMKYFTSVTLMNGFGTPRPLLPGQLRPMLTGAWVPFVGDEQRFVGFNGTKQDDLNKLHAFGRLALTVGLPWWLQFTVGYVPPIQINGVKANLLSFSLARPFFVRPHFTVGLSLYGQVGAVDGDFTCSKAEVRAGNDPQKNPFGCIARSKDRLLTNYVGLELSASYRIDCLRGLEPYTSVAANFMDLDFHVRAEYSDIVDRTKMSTQGGTFSTASGLLYPITRRLDVAGEVFYTPLTVQRPGSRSTSVEGLVNVRAMVAYRFF